MIEDLRAEVWGTRIEAKRREVAVKFSNGKVIRFITDETDWVVGEPVLVKMVRP